MYVLYLHLKILPAFGACGGVGSFYLWKAHSSMTVWTGAVYVGFAVCKAAFLYAEKTGDLIFDFHIFLIFLLTSGEIFRQAAVQKQNYHKQLHIIENSVAGDKVQYK